MSAVKRHRWTVLPVSSLESSSTHDTFAHTHPYNQSRPQLLTTHCAPRPHTHSFKRLVDTETLPPAAIPRGNTPLCMSQTARIFNHARIPRATRDELVNYGTAPKGLDGLQHFATKWTGDNPRHLAIIGPSGMIHCMDVVDDSGNALSTEHIAAGLEALLAEDAKVALPELSLAHFTGASRTKWAECRDMVLDVHKDHKVWRHSHPPAGLSFALLLTHHSLCCTLGFGGHQSTLHDIDSAMFVLVLDQRAPETLVDMARLFLHGQGAPRWFDKHQLIVCANGVAGLKPHCLGQCSCAAEHHTHASHGGLYAQAGTLSMPQGMVPHHCPCWSTPTGTA